MNFAVASIDEIWGFQKAVEGCGLNHDGIVVKIPNHR